MIWCWGEFMISDVKIITFYLPQYHQIKENDEWWGKGFTEWSNVKKAKPLFEGQVQPKVPLNNNYYDLMDKSTVEWQTELMHKYGVYGFCYFHYWFKGKQLLEKPAENLLKWKDIDQPFCFAWANVTWARTWTAVKKFSTNWVEGDDKQTTDINKNDDGILMLQEYGCNDDWRKHYYYLREFFKDNRYIKKDGKPVFLIYKLHDIDCAGEMFSLWNDLAKKDGFNGIYIVSINEYPQHNLYVNAVAKYGMYGMYDKHILREFFNSVIKKIGINNLKKPMILNYEKVWRGMIEEEYPKGLTVYPGGVVTYDETPRKGKNACFIQGASPKFFEKYLMKQLVKAKKIGAEYLFLDAWNEWGEGNYLEPDIEHEFEYLEALLNARKNYANNSFL